MAGILAPAFPHIIVSTPGTYKKSAPEQVFSTFKNLNPGALFEPEPERALSAAKELSGGALPILVTGSFYMAAEIRRLILP